MDSGEDAPPGRGNTTSAHEASEASGSHSVDVQLLTTPASRLLKVSDRARLALEASPYSERQVRRRESRARANAHAGTRPRGVSLEADPSASKAPVVGPDDSRRETEKRVAAADDDCERDATPRASGPATSTTKPSAHVVRQSPEAHARRLKAAADELLRTPLLRVASASPVGAFDVGSDASRVSPSPPRRARFGDPTPASTPAGRAAIALVRSRASAAWNTPGTDCDDRARGEDAGAFRGTPVLRAAAARDRLRERREAMAERVAAAERAYGASVRTNASSVPGGNAKRASRTSERQKNVSAFGSRSRARGADAAPADESAATPATPAWSTSYGGGSASARRAARLAAMTPHRAPREFREFREFGGEDAGLGGRPGPAAPVPETRRRTPATDDASTAPRVSQKPPSPSKDEALAALRETTARRKRARRARREATLRERAKRAAEATAPATSRLTLARARLSDRSFERARAAYGTDPKARPAPVLVTARPLVKEQKTPEPPVLPMPPEKKRRRERRVAAAAAAAVAAAVSPYSASPRVALRRKRFVPASVPTNALPTLVAFRPRPPDREPTQPGDDDPDGVVVLPRRPRRPTRPTRPARTARRAASSSPAAAEVVLPPAPGRSSERTRTERRVAYGDETRGARPATEAKRREREKEKASAAALGRTARRLREAAARRARVREARREKTRTLTPGKAKPAELFPDFDASRARGGVFSSPFPRLGSHALGSHLPARAKSRSRPEGASSKSPFAPASGATSRRRDHAVRSARDAVGDAVDAVIDALILDAATHARKGAARAERAERRRVRERRREAEIYAQDLAKKAAEASRLARRSRRRPSPSPRTKPRPSRVDGVVRSRVDASEASARREAAAKRRERRRVIERRRAADFAKLALAREKKEAPLSSETKLPPIEKQKRKETKGSGGGAAPRSPSPFEFELARFPRGVSAFDWEAQALPLGAAAAYARAASAFAGVSALKSARKRRPPPSTRDAAARRARRGRVKAETKRRVEKQNDAVARVSHDSEADDGAKADEDPVDPAALAAAADALRAVEASAFATLASFAEVDRTVDELVERESHIEAVAARAARGAAAKEARARALESAREEAAAKASREASPAAAPARRASAAERAAAYVIDTVLVNETVRIAEELHLARRISALRAQHEALRKRLEWRDKLEHTPRAVLRRVAYTAEEEEIIRCIEPALAIRTVKDANYDPFTNGPDMSWAVTDEERAEQAQREREKALEALEASGLASTPSARRASGAFAWDPSPIAVGAAAASRRATAAYGGSVSGKQKRPKKARSESARRRRVVRLLVREAIGRVVRRDVSFFNAEARAAPTKTRRNVIRGEAAFSLAETTTDAPRAVAPDAVDLELVIDTFETENEADSKPRGDAAAETATGAAAETASSGSEPERDVRAWRRERRSAKPAKPRTAFEKPRAGARPPSPVSPLTPSGVVISPLSISLRGVRKSLA